jgi:glycosyltransferase involved in cell wall biosynthesis
VQRHTRPYARYYFGTFALQRYRHAAAIAVDSAFSRGELLGVLDFPPERVHVVYPGVAEDFCALRRRPSGERVILVPGTVERRKNLEVLLRALRDLPEARIVSVGPSTAYREKCEALAKDLGVQDRLEFRGYVERSQLLELYATCAVVAVPSRYEGFGYAAAQALCAGTPVVVSDRSSLPEVVNGAAPIATADDEREWIGAIDEIFSNPQTAQSYAEEHRAAAIDRYSWNTSAAAMQRIYESTHSGA